MDLVILCGMAFRAIICFRRKEPGINVAKKDTVAGKLSTGTLFVIAVLSFDLSTHEIGGLSTNDFILAAKVNQLEAWVDTLWAFAASRHCVVFALIIDKTRLAGGDMDARMLASYHEAGHVVVAWLLGIPVEVVEVSHEGRGRTQLSLWYRSTAMFRDVNQSTVYRDTLFVLAGDCGERLLCPLDDEQTVSLDTYFAYVLSRRFKLDLRNLKEEASRMVVRQRDTIRVLAHLLYEHGTLDAYGLALLRMNWLARGKNLSYSVS